MRRFGFTDGLPLLRGGAGVAFPGRGGTSPAGFGLAWPASGRASEGSGLAVGTVAFTSSVSPSAFAVAVAVFSALASMILLSAAALVELALLSLLSGGYLIRRWIRALRKCFPLDKRTL